MPKKLLPTKLWTFLDYALVGTAYGVVLVYAYTIGAAYAYELLNGEEITYMLRGILAGSAIGIAICSAIAVFTSRFFIPMDSKVNVEDASVIGLFLGVSVLIFSEIYYISHGRVYDVEPITYFTLEVIVSGLGGAGVFAALATVRNWIRHQYQPK